MTPSAATQATLGSSRDAIDGSRTMVAWSIARLLATSPALRLRPPPRAAPATAAAEILLAVLDSPCDLDVILFAQRHPRALVRIDDIARAVGHDVGDVGASVDGLTATGLITTRQTDAEHREAGVVLYEFTPGAWDAILPALAWVAGSPEGRHDLRRALSHRRPAPPSGSTVARRWRDGMVNEGGTSAGCRRGKEGRGIEIDGGKAPGPGDDPPAIV